MTASIDRIKSNINQRGGIARPNNFLVELPSSAKLFKELTLIVLENMLYMILISSAALAFGTLKSN